MPANPAAITRMQRNAVDVLVGEPVDTRTSCIRFDLIFDVIIALLLAKDGAARDGSTTEACIGCVRPRGIACKPALEGRSALG